MTEEQNGKSRGSLLICLALIITIMIALVVYGIAMDAKKVQAEATLHKYDFKLLENWKSNYRLMEAASNKDLEKQALADLLEEQGIVLNQYENCVVSITDDMIQLNQEVAHSLENAL